MPGMHQRASFFLLLLSCGFRLLGQAGMLDEMFHIPHPPLAPAMTFLAIAGAGKLMTDPSNSSEGRSCPSLI